VTLADRLAEYYTRQTYAALAPDVAAKGAEHIAYMLMLALKGHRNAEEAGQAATLATRLSPDGGPATVVGTALRAQPIDAAFANATLMRALEIDDVMFPVGVHTGLVTTPSALAIAQRDHRSGKDLVTAVVAGYSIIGKLGNDTAAWAAAQPRRPTIPFGPFGGAVACGLLLGLDATRLAHAIRYAAQFAMGLAEGNDWLHYYSVVARNGMFAALVAEAGGRVSGTVLEGKYGFFETFFGAVPASLESLDPSGSVPAEILGTTTKRYPGTGLNIVGVELMRALVRSEGIRADDVERLDVALPVERENFAVGHTLGPFQRWRACSSLPFQMAMVVVDGGETKFERYYEPENPDILRVVGKTHVTFESGHSFERYARFELITKDGRRFQREGETYEFPPLDLAAEIVAAGAGIVPEKKLVRATELLARLDALGDVGELMECFAS
jgi:2-methylcitrate dehydratase PrpD